MTVDQELATLKKEIVSLKKTVLRLEKKVFPKKKDPTTSTIDATNFVVLKNRRRI